MADINNDHRTKKRNVCDNIIFEVELDDCSPEHSPKNGTDGKGSQKTGEFCFSQDSGVFSQGTNFSTSENELGETGIIERDKRKDETTVIEKEDGEIDVVESESCVETDSADGYTEKVVLKTVIQANACLADKDKYVAVGKTCAATTVDENNTKQTNTAERYITTQLVTKEAVCKNEYASVAKATIVEDDRKPTNTTERDIVTKTTKETVDAKQTNVEECVKMTQVVTKEILAHGDEQTNFKDNHIISCETVDSMISSNNAEDGEIRDERNNSIITISFKDTDIAKEYKSFFLKFLRTRAELNVVEAGEDGLKLEITRDPDLATNDWVVVDESFEERPDTFKPRKRKRSERRKEKDLFMLDTNPSITTKENLLRYLSKFSVVETEEGQKELDATAKPVGASCFNCDGNHSLKDCVEPKNYTKINMARNIFKNNQSKSARYHLEEDQMYGHLTPGKISDKLRKALGLHKHDLPPYIYRMRVLGYPPGWIKEAEEEASDLYMFDIDGKSVSNHKRKKSCIDPKRIVEYPGFNVPMEKGVHDDFRFYRVPPFSAGHDKQVMIDFINNMKAKQEDDLEVCDMEVDKIVDESITEISENDVSQESQDETQESSRASPTLIDLETRKQQLLAELDTNTTTDSLKLCGPDAKESRATVKTSSFGTPILKSASPYAKLPKPDNFSQNISPVINFENLPNATGKYEQMTGILHKVRTALKGLQGERKT